MTNKTGSLLLGFRGQRGPDWHERAFCRRHHLGFLHHGLLVSLDVVVSETLDRLLFGLELIFEDLELDLVLPELLPLLLQVKPQLPQLFVQSVLVRLEVADLLAINLILLALLLDLLRLPIELVLLNAVLVKLLLQRIILGNYGIVLFVKFVLFLLEVGVLP